MRLATLILSLILMLVVVAQSCAAGVGGAIVADKAASGAAGAGVLIAVLFLIGGAFVMHFPLVSTIVFAFGGLVGTTTPTGLFRDLQAWGWISFVFAVMSFIGWVGKRRAARRSAPIAPAGPTFAAAGPGPAPTGAPPTPPQSSNRWAWDCPSCRFRNQPGATFCGGCGAAQASAS